MTDLDVAISEFGSAAKAKLDGPGQREALLSGPIASLIERIGALAGRNVVAHNEVTELDGTVRPDFGVRVDSALTGYVELKAPGVSLDPASYGRTTHNFRQWQRLKELPNLLYTNGLEWRLWRYGNLVDQPVHLHAADLRSAGKNLKAPPRFELILRSFLEWAPVPIVSVSRLVEVMAPLARMLKEEVRLALQAERRAIKAGRPAEEQPFLGIAADWRALLFPQATDEQFSDGYAQTVTFALLLAVSDGIDVRNQSLNTIAQGLAANHSLMARALNLLTEHIASSPASVSVEMLVRVLSVVDWARVQDTSKQDLYLHLYEHFLSEYDPEKRRASGSYYTPVPVVNGMVALTDEVLRTRLNRPQGFRSPNVTVVDPAMGTGTYPLAVVRRAAQEAATQYGPGAAPEAVASVVERIYGLELQSAAFSVAELRMTTAIRQFGAEFPKDGLKLYVADTLEDPNSGGNQQLSYTLQLIAKQRRLANRMKREKNIQVCIGNPPYADHAGGQGGWIETGYDSVTGGTPLDAFRLPGNGLHERHLSNLYIYFWRWAFWKVFESTHQPDVEFGDTGVVCFITATGYLAGPGFKGMRRYIRERCSEGWIINLTPEGKQPPARSAVFNIETPVAIGLFVRQPDSNPSIPAHIQYIELGGDREEKFAKLQELSIDSSGWRPVRSGWTDTFIPPAGADWDNWPAMDDLFPWKAAGIMAGHAYVYGPTREIVEERLTYLVQETDPVEKSKLFREGRDSSLDKVKKPLAGEDTEQDTNKPFRSIALLTDPKIVPVGFRAFDRQWVAADSRLLIQPSPDLWRGRQASNQLYAIELHSEYPKAGPALTFTSLIPDAHFFRGSGGGRALPMFHADDAVNLAAGLLKALSDRILDARGTMKPEHVMFYVAGVTAHPGFVRQFDAELRTPGVRVPITADADCWERAVTVGKHVVWLHTFGERGAHPENLADIRGDNGIDHPTYDVPVGSMPEGFSYSSDSTKLFVGSGMWSGVTPDVRRYTVGGTNVLDSWLGYRMKSPRGRRTTPLDHMNVQSWPSAWSVELSEVLSVLTQLVALEPSQEALLDEILTGPLLTTEDLVIEGAILPPLPQHRKARSRGDGGLPFDD